MSLFDTLVLIRGAGDLASGAAYRLVKAGFPVVMTELPKPIMVRTMVSYGSCVQYGSVIIEGVNARRANLDRREDLNSMLAEGAIPVLVDPEGESLRVLRPSVLVDARLRKVNLGTEKGEAPLVIGLGPGFTAGVDCHAVVETNRGHYLGRVYWRGGAEPDTGAPGAVNGKAGERVLRAPLDGLMLQVVPAGVFVHKGTPLARIGDAPVLAPFDGVLRGLIDDDVFVTASTKIGDLDPRARREYCFTISDKSLAVGSGVVEAIFSAPQAPRLLRLAAVSEARS